MSFIQIDLVGWIPDSLKQQITDGVVTFVADQAKKTLGDEVSQAIKRLRSDAAFQDAVDRGLKEATDRFVREYTVEDEDLVAAIAGAPDFWKAESVRQALLEIIQHPGVYLAEEQITLARSFADVLRQRVNRERVDRAVTFYLRCVAESLWHLEPLRPIYELQMQRLGVERATEMVQEMRGMRADVQEALVALVRAVGEQQKLLTAPDRLALQEPKKVYHNLPQPDYGTFIGREEELVQIHRILRPHPHSRHYVMVIDGIGGIGKSALALEAAHRYLRDYDRLPPEERFEAIIWTSAKSSVLTADGITPRQQIARTLDDIYTTISVTLEREDITRARPEEQDELVRRALTQQRTLLVVDNMETVDDERANAFLRELPAPTKAVVTTRHRIDVAYPIRLAGMPKEDGLALIVQECAKKGVTLTEAEAEKLYKRTGGVPLAIVWSVAQIGYGYGVEAVLRRLGQPSEDINRFCFEGAMQRIRGTDAHKLLMTLSLFATDASREALGYVAGLGEDVLGRDEGLVVLERLSLVNKRGGRFGMLPLTKRYASSELMGSVAKPDLVNQWIDYFVRLSDKYGGEHWLWTNYEWLLAEGDNILSLADWAVASDRVEVILSLYYAIMRYLDIEGRWVELVKYGELLYEIAQSLNERRVQAWICTHWLGYFCAEQEVFVRAEEISREGVALYQEIRDKKGMCHAMANLSRALRKSGQMKASEQKAQEVLKIAREISYGDGMADAYDQIGKISRDSRIWTDAKECFEKAQSLCERGEANTDISFLMNILGNLGWVEFNLGNYEQGKELCERSLDFFNRMGGRGHTTSLQCRLAAIENALGNGIKARQYAQEALYWSERLQMPHEAKIACSLLEQMVDSTEQPRAAEGYR